MDIKRIFLNNASLMPLLAASRDASQVGASQVHVGYMASLARLWYVSGVSQMRLLESQEHLRGIPSHVW